MGILNSGLNRLSFGAWFLLPASVPLLRSPKFGSQHSGVIQICRAPVRVNPINTPHRPRIMASMGLYENPGSSYIVLMGTINVVSGILGFRSEMTGTGLQYSKFAVADQKKFQLTSKTGMLVIYLPAALVSTLFLAQTLGFFPLHSLLETVGLTGVASFLQQSSFDSAPRVLYVAAALSLHFSKRVFEVLFLHRYSGTRSAAQTFLIISSSYTLNACNLLYAQVLSSDLPPPSVDLVWLGIPVFLVGIFGNLYHHYVLANLRKDGSRKYAVPHGGLFEYMVCPHYFFEMVDYLGVALISQTVLGVCQLAFVIMYLTSRSLSTKQWYLKNVDGFPSERF